MHIHQDTGRSQDLIQTALTQFVGSYRVSEAHESGFPRAGTPVTIEANRRDATITVGGSGDLDRRLRLTGRLDAATRSLRGSYDDQNVFELSLGRFLRQRRPGPSDGGSSQRGLSCVIRNRIIEPESSSWDADEDGPG